MNLPTIVICLAEARTNLNRIWEAMGRGPNNISVPLCVVDPLATPESSPTHFMMQDMGAGDQDAAVWRAMAENNDLPPIAGIWGEDGVISAAEAQVAISSGNMQVYSAAGLTGVEMATDWRNGILVGTGLQFVPSGPL